MAIDFDQYLREVDKIIPVTMEEQRVRQASYDDSGTLKARSDNAFVQQHFEVDFSWWTDISAQDLRCLVDQ